MPTTTTRRWPRYVRWPLIAAAIAILALDILSRQRPLGPRGITAMIGVIQRGNVDLHWFDTTFVDVQLAQSYAPDPNGRLVPASPWYSASWFPVGSVVTAAPVIRQYVGGRISVVQVLTSPAQVWSRSFSIPLWPLWLFVLALGGGMLALRTGRFARGACAACGYDRQGIDAATPCPECGAPPGRRDAP